MKKIIAVAAMAILSTGCMSVMSYSPEQLQDKSKVNNNLLLHEYAWSDDKPKKLMNEMLRRNLVRDRFIPSIKEGIPMVGMTYNEVRASCGAEKKQSLSMDTGGTHTFLYYYKGIFKGCPYIDRVYIKNGKVVSVTM